MTEVKYRCPNCKKVNPIVESAEMGISADSVLVGFRLLCCRTLIGCQLVARVPEQAAVPV